MARSDQSPVAAHRPPPPIAQSLPDQHQRDQRELPVQVEQPAEQADQDPQRRHHGISRTAGDEEIRARQHREHGDRLPYPAHGLSGGGAAQPAQDERKTDGKGCAENEVADHARDSGDPARKGPGARARSPLI